MTTEEAKNHAEQVAAAWLAKQTEENTEIQKEIESLPAQNASADEESAAALIPVAIKKKTEEQKGEAGLKIATGEVGHGTRIDQIVVPPKLKIRIDTKLPWWNACLSGDAPAKGATPTTVGLLTGTPGAGKTTMILQLAAALASRDDTVVLFNSAEESVYQVKMVCERLFKHWTQPPRFYIGEDRLVDDRNPDLNPQQKKQVKLGNPPPSIFGHARKLARANPGKFLFVLVDSLQAVDDGKYNGGFTNGGSPSRVMKLITNFCKQTYAIALVIGRVNKSGEFSGRNEIIHDIDIHAHMKIDTDEDSDTCGMRILEMRKNRFGFAGWAHVLKMKGTGLHEYGSKGTSTSTS